MKANTDPLDTAYLAIGAARMLDQMSTGLKAHAGVGELELIQMAIDAAPVLQKLWDELGENFAGVWAYDVAEPLGADIVFQYLGNDLDPTPEGIEKMARVRIGQVLG